MPNCDYLAGPPAVVSRSSISNNQHTTFFSTSSSATSFLLGSTATDLLHFVLLFVLVHILLYGNFFHNLLRRLTPASPRISTTTISTAATPTEKKSVATVEDQARGSSLVSSAEELLLQSEAAVATAASSASTTSTATVATVDRLSRVNDNVEEEKEAAEGKAVHQHQQITTNTTAKSVSDLCSTTSSRPFSFSYRNPTVCDTTTSDYYSLDHPTTAHEAYCSSTLVTARRPFQSGPYYLDSVYYPRTVNNNIHFNLSYPPTATKMVDMIHMNNNGGQQMYGGPGSPQDGYMEQEEEWEREGLLDPAWEKQQRKVQFQVFFCFSLHLAVSLSVSFSSLQTCFVPRLPLFLPHPKPDVSV